MITLTIPKSAETQMYAPDAAGDIHARQEPRGDGKCQRRAPPNGSTGSPSTSTTIQRKHGTNPGARRASDSRAELASDVHSLRATADRRDWLSLTLRKARGADRGGRDLLAVAAAFARAADRPGVFDTFPQALWFSVTTVTTVGYGDYVPESGAGRAGRLRADARRASALIPLITSVVVSILVSQRSREARAEEMRELTADPRAARQPRAQARAASGRASRPLPSRISPDPHDDRARRRKTCEGCETNSSPDVSRRSSGCC